MCPSEANFYNKSSCLDAALDMIKFTTIIAMNLNTYVVFYKSIKAVKQNHMCFCKIHESEDLLERK